MDIFNISDIFSELELLLINSMKRNLERHIKDELAEGFNWTQWQAVMLQNMQKYRKQNTAIVGRSSKHIDKAVRELLKSQYSEAGDKTKKAILKSIAEGHKTRLEPDNNSFFGINDRKLNALIDTTQTDFRQAQYSAIRLMDDEYRKIIYKSQVYANMGALTVPQALDMATKDFLSKGINSITYKNGRRVSIDSYAEIAIRTANKRAYLMGEGAMRKEWGESLVLVGATGTGCPNCIKFMNKVLVDNVYSGGKETDYNGKYQTLSYAIGEGFLHPQCIQPISTYFEGITEIPPPADEKEVIKNYDLAQQQRSNERHIRMYKRLEAGSFDPENKKKYRDKIKEWQQKQRDFLKENPQLRRDYSREQTRGILLGEQSQLHVQLP